MEIYSIQDYLCNCKKYIFKPNIFWILGENKQYKDQFIDSLISSLDDKITVCPNNILINDYLYRHEIIQSASDKRVLLFRCFKDFDKIKWLNLKSLIANENRLVQCSSTRKLKILELNLSIVIESEDIPIDLLNIKDNYIKRNIQFVNMDQYGINKSSCPEIDEFLELEDIILTINI